MGRITILLALATILLPDAAAARVRDCGPAGAATIEHSAAARVYFTESDATKRYYACWRRTHGKPVSIDEVKRPEFINRFRLRGRYLSYVEASCSRMTGCDSFQVARVDVKRGRHLGYTDYLDGSVRTLVATRGGAVAFLATDRREQYIQKLDSFGVEEIDRGPDVHSLTLHGGRLHWLHGTQPRDEHIAHVSRCGPIKGAVTVALSKRMRVYYTDPFNDGEETRSYACLLGGGAPLFLGQDSPSSTSYSYHYDFQLRGDHVVWLEYGCYMGCLARIHSADVRGRTKRSGSGFHDVPTVFANERGFAAELVPSEGTPRSYSILGFDSTGERLLDEGEGIDPSSVMVFADAVVWRHDGEQRSAPLR